MEKSARDKLNDWISNRGLKKCYVAGLIPVLPGTMSDWLSGRVKPSRIARARIEEITAGAVAAADWGEY